MLLSFFLVLATFVLLLAYTGFHLSKTMDKKPEALVKILDKMTAHMEVVSYWSAIYGIVGSILTLLTIQNTSVLFVNLVANVMITLMALPFAFDKIVAVVGSKIDNPVIVDEARNLANWVTKNEKFISYVGAAVCILLFTIKGR